MQLEVSKQVLRSHGDIVVSAIAHPGRGMSSVPSSAKVLSSDLHCSGDGHGIIFRIMCL